MLLSCQRVGFPFCCPESVSSSCLLLYSSPFGSQGVPAGVALQRAVADVAAAAAAASPPALDVAAAAVEAVRGAEAGEWASRDHGTVPLAVLSPLKLLFYQCDD